MIIPVLRRIVAFGVCAVIAFVPISSRAQVSPCPESSSSPSAECNSPAPEPTETNSADLLRATLDNGLRVVVVRDPLAPVVETVVNYLVGSDEAPPGFPGMAHAQEHMMFRSSSGLSTVQLADSLALLGGRFDADTQQALTQYYSTVPTAYLGVILHLEATRMSGVLDRQSEWDQERKAIEQEVSSDLSGAEYRYHVAASTDLFAKTPYAHDALGTKSSFDATTGAMLKSFHDTWYAPNNAILVIVGDVDPQATLNLVRANFGVIPSHPLPERPSFTFSPVTPTTHKLPSDYALPYVIRSFRTPGYEDPSSTALQIAVDVLNSQRGPLYALQADGKALGTGVSLNLLPKAGFADAYIATEPGGDTSAAGSLLGTTLLNSVRDGVPDALVEAAKRQEIAQAEFSRNSLEDLAFDWSQALALEGLASPDERIARISTVTTADVDQVIRKVFDDQHAVVGVLVPKGAGAASNGEGFGGKESFAPTSTKRVALPDWAHPLLETPVIPSPALAVTDQRLPNGIRLIVVPSPTSSTVVVRGAIEKRSALQEPRKREGVGAVLESLFSYGTTTLDRVAFARELDDIAATESAGSSFSLDVTADHFERGMHLLADNLLHPALPASAFQIVQKQTEQSLAGEAVSPDYLAGRALLKALLPKDDPELRHATTSSVAKVTLEDVRAYLQRVFRPDMATIVVAGAITPELARATVEKEFGDWSAEGVKPVLTLPSVKANVPSKIVVPATGRQQSDVILAENVGVRRESRDAYAIQLGDAILGGGFYATRLYHDLREQSGLVYFVSAGLQADKTRSRYRIQYGSDPSKVAKARAIIDADLRAMGTGHVTPDELRLAKATIVRDLSLSEAGLDEIAGGLEARSLHHLPLNEPTIAARTIVSLGPEDVRAAFARWIAPRNFVQVEEGPSPLR